MTEVYHYVDLSGLTECYAFVCRPIDANGGWTATVLFFRSDALTPESRPVPAVRQFGEFDTQQGLFDHLEEWIRGSLSEHWARYELHDVYQPA